MEAKLKHLEFIQGVINRMAANSFLLKGWAVVLTSAIAVVAVREQIGLAALTGLIPVAAFWGLDAYYLRQERLFRGLYNHVRAMDEDQIDFDMNTAHVPAAPKYRYMTVFGSVTLLGFYAAIAIGVGGVAVLSYLLA